jgi:hypothetical protein
MLPAETEGHRALGASGTVAVALVRQDDPYCTGWH